MKVAGKSGEHTGLAPGAGGLFVAAARPSTPPHASHGGGDESKELRTRSACTEPVRSLWQGRGVAHAGSWREGLRARERGGAARRGHMYMRQRGEERRDRLRFCGEGKTKKEVELTKPEKKAWRQTPHYPFSELGTKGPLGLKFRLRL